MTAEALSATEADVSPRSAAADGPPPSPTNSDTAPALAQARQSVVDVVAARLEQVPVPEVAGTNGAAPDGAGTLGGPAAGVRSADEVSADGAAPEVAAEAAPAVAPAAPAAEAPAAAVVAEVEAVLQPTGDPGRFAATAVLDVLRASGWADSDEARRLRAEADRLRELLDLVVRDHRAREASAAGLESRQQHWLIPLLRAAHGVAFGSLGAKVALRTAVQDVPEQILAAAGLRIDYGVEQPDGEASEEHSEEH